MAPISDRAIDAISVGPVVEVGISVTIRPVYDAGNAGRVKSGYLVPTRGVAPLLTVGDYLDAGLELRSFCSSGRGHSHLVDLVKLAEQRGRASAIDFALKVSLNCPACGSPGGGIEIRKPE